MRKWRLPDLQIRFDIAAISKIKYLDETIATYYLVLEFDSRTKEMKII